MNARAINESVRAVAAFRWHGSCLAGGLKVPFGQATPHF